MNLSDALSLLSPAVGFIGAVVQKGVGIFEERQRHRNEMEKLELASRIDVQKADIALRQTREAAAGESFTEAIKAQAALPGATAKTKDIIALFRPGLTALVLVASISHATYLTFLGGVDATEFWRGIHALASMAFGYWFGVRSFEKSEIRLAAPVRK